MTIHGCWEYFNKHGEHRIIPASSLAGHFIPFDYYGDVYAYRAVARKHYLSRINPFVDPIDENEITRLCLEKLLSLIMRFLSWGIVPVLIYDAPEKTEAKAQELEKRQQVELQGQAKCQQIFQTHQHLDVNHIPHTSVAALRSALEVVNKAPPGTMDLVRDFFIGLGLPYAISTGEAERTCALMVRDGSAPAARTKDSDALACHCNIVLRDEATFYRQTEFGQIGEPGFKAAYLEDFLELLGLDFPAFQDLCIYAGTDFSSKYRHSFVTAYKHMKDRQAYSFEELERYYDVSAFRYAEVRQQFALVPWETTVSECQLQLVYHPEMDQQWLEWLGAGQHWQALQDYKLKIFQLLTPSEVTPSEVAPPEVTPPVVDPAAVDEVTNLLSITTLSSLEAIPSDVTPLLDPS
jgi:hypothetical protein